MLNDRILRELRAIVGDDYVRAGPAQLIAYSYDATFQQAPPDAVVLPRTTEQVAAVLRLANRDGIPLIPRGAGTSLAGGTIPLTGGIVLSLTRMNDIKEIDVGNTCAVVEPGVVTATFQAAVEKVGLFYPPDPASLNQSTLGGNVACNAGGPRCLKYGVTRDYVLGLTVALADGRVLRLGGKTIKNVSGYQLIQLFTASEGTLGVITQITLRLVPLPRHRSTAVAIFPKLDDAGDAVTAVLGSGVLPVTLELMDKLAINCVEDYLHMGLPRDAEALLLIEQGGNSQMAVQQEIETVAAACKETGASDVRVATSPEEREALWRARRAVSAAIGRRAPNKIGEDVVVPRSQVPEMVRRVRRIGEEHGFETPIFGHAGDGNLHPNFLFDRRKPGEMERLERAAAAVFRAALDLGGTLSGEHGIGTLKREFMEDALGADTLGVMRAIKQALDPKGILNPGKKFPTGTTGDHSGFLTALPTLDSPAGEE